MLRKNPFLSEGAKGAKNFSPFDSPRECEQRIQL